jgi:hypothetical protein
MKRTELESLIERIITKVLTEETEKEKWINKVMNSVYSDDDDKYYDSNYKYLETLSVEKLKDMYDNYKNAELR